MPKYTDQEIIAAIKSGGKALEDVMRFIYNHDGYRQKIFRFVKSKGGQIHDAEDVFQDGIRNLILSVRKNKFRGETAIEGYLFAVCRNLWFKQFNKSIRITDLPENPKEDKVDQQSPEILMVTEERKKILNDLLAALGEKCKKVLELWRLNYSMKEIAAAVGYSSDGMARKKKHQCMQELVKQVKSAPNLIEILRN